MIIKDIEISPLNLELKEPFVTALGRKNVTRNVLVILRLSNGPAGYGEASSSLAIPTATQEVMMRELIGLSAQVKGMSLSEAMKWIQAGPPAYVHRTSFSALEMAVYDASARARGIGLYRLFGKAKKALETSFTISAWPQDLARKVISRERRRGFRRFKIKVGTNWDDDLKRVIAAQKNAPGARFMIDGNQGFTLPGAIEFVNELKRRNIPIEFLEQPVGKENSLEEWAWLKKRLGVPLALDESITTCGEAEQFANHGTVDVINIKLAKSGIGESLRIIELAKRRGIRLMIGCMAESAIGLSASVHLAAGTGIFDAVDLDSSYLLKPSKHLKAGFVSRGPHLRISAGVKGSGASVERHL